MHTFSFETLATPASHNALGLWFVSYPDLRLERTLFNTVLSEAPILAVRGKSPGAFTGAATFQWYLGPQALVVFLLKAKLHKANSFLPMLEGTAGSIAACLNDAIEKTSWIQDLFGCRADGGSIVRRVVSRSNSRRRGGMCVAMSLNEKFLRANDVHIFLDGALVESDEAVAKLCAEIELIWEEKKSQTRPRPTNITQKAA